MKYFIIFGNEKITEKRDSYPAQIGLYLNELGLETTYMMLDPILNLSTGNISPENKGEIFVLCDGTETDLSLGIFERTCEVNLTKHSYLTVSKILMNIIEGTKEGYYNCSVINFQEEVDKYLESHIRALGDIGVKKGDGSVKNVDAIVVDVHGIMGDRSLWFLANAILKFIKNVGEKDEVYIISCDRGGEVSHKSNDLATLINLLKTEKIEKNVFSYLAYGDDRMNLLRCISIGEDECLKIIKECGSYEEIFTKETVKCILNGEESENKLNNSEESATFYIFDENENKIKLADKDFNKEIYNKIISDVNCPAFEKIKQTKICFTESEKKKFLTEENDERIEEPKREIKIFLLSEFSEASNGYCSVVDSLIYANDESSTCVKVINFDIHREEYANYERLANELCHADGILIPGGFNSDAIETRLNAIRYAREQNIPFLSICLGFQIALIEFAINVLGISNATSEEFDHAAKENVICCVKNACCKNTGEDIFLGDYSVTLKAGEGESIYAAKQIHERFRHRYAFNTLYKDRFEEKGLVFFGKSSHDCLVLFKLAHHKFFTGVQYHPELISKRNKIDPIIKKFIAAANTTHSIK